MTDSCNNFCSRIPDDVLLAYQKRFIRDTSRVKVIEKARRIGITWAEAADDVLLAASGKGMDVFYIGYNRDMAQEFIRDAGWWARKFQAAASPAEETLYEDDAKDIRSFRIRFLNGKRITALSGRPANLRGKQGKVVIDEAAFHDDLPELLKAAIALLMWGGRVSIISTHNGAENPFNLLVNDIRSGKTPYSLHRVTLDDALNDGLFGRICLSSGVTPSRKGREKWRMELFERYGDAADEELMCIPAKSGGIYLSRALVESVMSPDFPVIRLALGDDFLGRDEEIRKKIIRRWCDENLSSHLDAIEHLPFYFGEDFGRTGDLTVIFPLLENPDLTLFTPFIIELRNIPFRHQEEILFYLLDRVPNLVKGAMDARGNGQYLAEVSCTRYGEKRIERVMLSESWYRENMPRYKSCFEEKRITLPKDGDILDDHLSLKMQNGIAKVPEGLRKKGRDGKPRHGDSAIAGALALYSVQIPAKTREVFVA